MEEDMTSSTSLVRVWLQEWFVDEI